MVLKKKTDYGINGFLFSNVPRAPRSVRRRNSHKKTVEDSQTSAFELLASIADQLLHESSSASSLASKGKDKSTFSFGKDVIKQERRDESIPMEAMYIEQKSCKESVFVSESASKNSNLKFSPKRMSCVESDVILKCPSVITSSDCSAKFDSGRKSLIYEGKTASGNFLGEVDRPSPDYGEFVSNVEKKPQRQFGEKQEVVEDLTIANKCESKYPLKLQMEFLNTHNTVKVPLRRDLISNASSSSHRNDVSLGSRDDVKNFSRCHKPSSKKSSSSPPHIEDRKIRKLLASKHWKVAPNLKDCEHSPPDEGVKPLYRKRKACYRCERCQRDVLCKWRKLHDHSSLETYDAVFSTESVSNSPEKGVSGDKSGSAVTYEGGFSTESVSNSPEKGVNGATTVSCSPVGYQTSFHPKDSSVKFSIKSFRVPELIIEAPEIATVGSLKRTVMEAVTTLLGGELRVGVLLHGKKVRDDNRTLLQTGFSSKDNLDALGFILESSPAEASPLTSLESPHSSLPCDAPQHSTRSAATSVLEVSDAIADPPSLTNSGNLVTINHESVSSHTDISTDITMSDSKALVAFPAMSVDALAVVPVDQKTRRSELMQRRTRRPFSVSEVESLVQAVEDLGTGRWRDVKLRAFEIANHRTYVDLKDKWKTLVHTAKIYPQRRRGEPVPQELLDRVLAAHSYWTQHQAKQQGKHQTKTPKITDTQDNTIEVATGI